ncbi:MAG: pilus assembly FimT family protein [Desulfovibrio sp.]
MQISKAGDLNKSSGFTLFEILIVLVILALSAGLVVPMVTSFDDRDDIYKGVDEVLAAITVARSRAILSGSTVELQFTDKSLSLSGESDYDLDAELPDNVKISYVESSSGQARQILFSKSGVCERTIVGLSSSGKAVTLLVYSVSGSRVYDGRQTFQDINKK